MGRLVCNRGVLADALRVTLLCHSENPISPGGDVLEVTNLHSFWVAPSLNNMNPYRRGRNSKRLLGLILLAIAYGSLLYGQRTITGTDTLDGAVGVLLGLYICSHPAANAVDSLLFGRRGLHQVSSGQSNVVWLALNLLTLLIGWLVLFIGATRFTAGAA